jgi:hypothetical protein
LGGMRLVVVICGCMESGDVLISGFRYPYVTTAASVGLFVRILAWMEFWAHLAFYHRSSSSTQLRFCDILSVVW